MHPWRKTLVLAVLFLLFLVPGALGQDRAPQEPLRDSGSPVTVVLTCDGQPGLNHTVTLTMEVTSAVAADHLRLLWPVPSGVTSAGPAQELLGAIAAGETRTFQHQVTFTQAGTFKVAAGAQIEFDNRHAIFGDADVLYFTIGEDGEALISDEAANTSSPGERIAAPEIRFTPSAAPNAGYWVSGRFMYEDMQVSADFSVPPVLTYTLRPARRILVEVMEDDGGDGPSWADDHDCSTHTDDDGYFSCWVPDDDDWGAHKETFVEFFAQNPAAHVSDISGFDLDYYCYTDDYEGGQDIDVGTLTPTDYDPMFHIADVLLDAYDYASQFRSGPEQAHARYEPGEEGDSSNYNPVNHEITMRGAGGDNDAYDDSSVIHEYGHYIADQYACDESEGGHHNFEGHYSNELAMSEGWGNYLSSAVQDSPLYRDVNDAGGWQISLNWETWISDTGVVGSDNEGAVAATLWDIHDDVDETNDRLSLGGDEIWYTFDNNMADSHDCTIYEFWDEWHANGYPDDSELAAIFATFETAGQHADGAEESVWRSSPPPPQPADPVRQPSPSPLADGAVRQPAGATPDFVMRGAVPWNVVLFLVDATSSMSGEIDAVRQIILDKIDDMFAEPYPYEYIVETYRDNGTNTAVTTHFFPDVVGPPIEAIAVSGGGDAEEDTWEALVRGTRDRLGYDAWLFTDAAPREDDTSEAQVEGLLQQREITPYFFVFGDCTGGNTAAAGAEPAGSHPVSPGQSHLPRFAPDGLEECVEPYLQLANGTNGQFLFIDDSQVDDAAEIVRAFMSNNAGAGRYADYVSSGMSYTWDDTTYEWYDATGGDYYCVTGAATVLLPQSFRFFNIPYSTLYASLSGYITFESGVDVPTNGPLPAPAWPNRAIYAFWDAFEPCVLEGGSPTGWGEIYTDYDAANNRFVIEYLGVGHDGGGATTETFEILLDYDTNEIIVQYAEVGDDSSCTVGVENATGAVATQVIYNNPGSLSAGRAIRFTPLLAQPTRDHEVIVDPFMTGVTFLLNGYSGDVDLVLYDPDGVPVDPADPGVTHFDLGKIEYYRIESPARGTWIARASGNGTYYFTSSSISDLTGTMASDPTQSSSGNQPILMDMGIPLSTDPTFSLVYPDGSFFADLNLYDDGGHGDGEADDGLYGGPYNAPQDGTFYVQVDGALSGGEAFRRTALTPLRFQGMELVALQPAERYAMPGSTLVYTFTLYNDTADTRVFSTRVNSSRNWASVPLVMYVIPPYGHKHVPVTVQVPAAIDGVVEETTLTALSYGMADNATVRTTVRGPAKAIDLAAYPEHMALGGHHALIVAQVGDSMGWSVADGTLVTLHTTLGMLNREFGTTVNGVVTATLISGATWGVAEVEAIAGKATEMVTVTIEPHLPYTLTLTAGASTLPPDGTSTTLLTAHVYDEYGDPAPDGSVVVFTVEGDGMEMGSVEGLEIYTATTSGGVATVTYRSGTTFGLATIWAELLLGDSCTWGPGEAVACRRGTMVTILLTGDYNIYLPLVTR